MQIKTCTKCGDTKPISEFYKRTASNDGYNTRCKECRKEVCRKFAQTHKKQIKRYYENNKDKILKQQLKYVNNKKR